MHVTKLAKKINDFALPLYFALMLFHSQRIYANSQIVFESDILSFHERTADLSVEAFMKLLPDGLRRNFLLIHKSSSLQSASVVAPRIILFQADPYLVLSITSANQNISPHFGTQHVEMIAFDAAKETFNFFDLRFVEDPTTELLQSKNPRVCTGCHGALLKPNWHNFPHWHGFFGNDRITEKDWERRLWSDFMQAGSFDHPNYRLSHLRGPLVTNRSHRITKGLEHLSRQNFKFGLLSDYYNIRRISRHIIDTAGIEAWQDLATTFFEIKIGAYKPDQEVLQLANAMIKANREYTTFKYTLDLIPPPYLQRTNGAKKAIANAVFYHFLKKNNLEPLYWSGSLSPIRAREAKKYLHFFDVRYRGIVSFGISFDNGNMGIFDFIDRGQSLLQRIQSLDKLGRKYLKAE